MSASRNDHSGLGTKCNWGDFMSERKKGEITMQNSADWFCLIELIFFMVELEIKYKLCIMRTKVDYTEG